MWRPSDVHSPKRAENGEDVQRIVDVLLRKLSGCGRAGLGDRTAVVTVSPGGRPDVRRWQVAYDADRKIGILMRLLPPLLGRQTLGREERSRKGKLGY